MNHECEQCGSEDYCPSCSTCFNCVGEDMEMLKADRDFYKASYDRLRAERNDAWDRATVYAKHSDRLEQLLKTITECACAEQFSCADLVTKTLPKLNRQFNEEWLVYREAVDAREKSSNG